jgi:predicted peptidase
MQAGPDEAVVAKYAVGETLFTGGEYVRERFEYRLMPPPRVVEGETYPLVIFLHGAGERGSDNRLQLLYLPELMASDERRAAFPCYVYAPQCRPDRKWVDLDWSADRSTFEREPSTQLAVVMQTIDELVQSRPIDRRRIYLTGLSMGGYGAWDLAARRPELFAALAPVCGGGDEATAVRLKVVPVWAFHGARDTVVRPERSRRMIEALRTAGAVEVGYTEYPDVGHDSWRPAYADAGGLVAWMFRKRLTDR